ncbi:hypothetical protein Ahu01nite_000010 [Winogradskya humida]|uniref:Transposase IS30-like HTH domain-containing protein n=2 Tax=Winogradskya humida TaxID=113566 RepID=A0ABQ3ZED3_9ACTN|nr:hypothetical protein Ahu01nite_000010 [Actinoplanes humidus]
MMTRRSRIYAPLTAPKPAVSALYLSENERTTIADEHLAGSSIRVIAALLDRAPSTISQEINRDSDPVTTIPSPPTSVRRPPPTTEAGEAANQRGVAQPGPRVAGSTVEPEQIWRTLPWQHPDRPEPRLTAETSYQALCRPDRGGLTRSNLPLLRTGRTYRKRRRSREQRTPRFTDRSKSIHDRPATADDRLLICR